MSPEGNRRPRSRVQPCEYLFRRRGSGEYFKADIDVLAQTVAHLRNTKTVLDDLRKAMTKDSDTDIGTTGLNDAVDNFQSRWQFGVERIGTNAGKTADGVGECLTAYQELDTSFAALFPIMLPGQIAPQEPN